METSARLPTERVRRRTTEEGVRRRSFPRCNPSVLTVGSAAVFGCDDVGLDVVLGGVGGVAGGHDAFVEGARGALAVVSADAQDDGALLVHRVVARHVRARPAVEGGQGPGL